MFYILLAVFSQPVDCCKHIWSGACVIFVQIWRVERRKDGTYGTVELERKYVGQMYGGDCYVVLYSYVARGRQHHIVYYWLVGWSADN